MAIKDLTPLQQEELARILMRKIIHFVDRPNLDEPRYQYVKPHLHTPGRELLQKFLKNLSAGKAQWYNDNCKIILLAKTDKLPDEILPYWQNKIQENVKKGLTFDGKPKQTKQQSKQPKGKPSGTNGKVQPNQ